jgi:hypothetical protein
MSKLLFLVAVVLVSASFVIGLHGQVMAAGPCNPSVSDCP